MNHNFASSIPKYIVDNEGMNTAVSVSDGVLNLTNGNSATIRFPFKAMPFDFSADIILSDLNTTRTISAWSSNDTTKSSYALEELFTIGTDGLIYASGSETALNETPITQGSYTLEADYILSSKLLRMKLINKDTSEVVATLNSTITDVLSGISVAAAALSDESLTSQTAIDNLSIATKEIATFAIDNANSTTGKGKVCYQDTPVIVKFTNPVDTSSFSAENITFPYTTVSEFDYEFTDSKTLRIYFEKEAGVHYHIAISNIVDVYGSKLSDYIEFDVLRKDFEIDGVQFKNAEGKTLSLLEPGTITASFKASANNGTTKNLFFALAQYEDSTLTSIVSNEFLVTEVDQPITLSTVVPQGYTGDLKAFVWEADTAKPLWNAYVIRSTTDLPIVILKLDDLGIDSTRLAYFDTAANMLEERGIKGSFGLMGYSMDGTSESGKQHVLDFYNNPLIEVWFHGYHWEREYIFSYMDEEGQREEFQTGVDSAANYGISYKSFGAPSNGIDKTTLELMDNEFTNFKVLMRPTSKNVDEEFEYTPENFVYLYHSVATEESSVIRPLEALKSSYNTAKANGYDYVLLQSHPWCWESASSDGNLGKENIESFLDWLIEEGAVFMTPSEYAEYITQ